MFEFSVFSLSMTESFIRDPFSALFAASMNSCCLSRDSSATKLNSVLLRYSW